MCETKCFAEFFDLGPNFLEESSLLKDFLLSFLSNEESCENFLPLFSPKDLPFLGKADLSPLAGRDCSLPYGDLLEDLSSF